MIDEALAIMVTEHVTGAKVAGVFHGEDRIILGLDADYISMAELDHLQESYDIIRISVHNGRIAIEIDSHPWDD